MYDFITIKIMFDKYIYYFVIVLFGYKKYTKIIYLCRRKQKLIGQFLDIIQNHFLLS